MQWLACRPAWGMGICGRSLVYLSGSKFLEVVVFLEMENSLCSQNAVKCHLTNFCHQVK